MQPTLPTPYILLDPTSWGTPNWLVPGYNQPQADILPHLKRAKVTNGLTTRAIAEITGLSLRTIEGYFAGRQVALNSAPKLAKLFAKLSESTAHRPMLPPPSGALEAGKANKQKATSTATDTDGKTTAAAKVAHKTAKKRTVPRGTRSAKKAAKGK